MLKRVSGAARTAFLQEEPAGRKKRLKKGLEYYKMEQVKRNDMCGVNAQFKED